MAVNEPYCQMSYFFIRNIRHSKTCDSIIANLQSAKLCSIYLPAHSKSCLFYSPQFYQCANASISVTDVVVLEYASLRKLVLEDIDRIDRDWFLICLIKYSPCLDRKCKIAKKVSINSPPCPIFSGWKLDRLEKVVQGFGVLGDSELLCMALDESTMS